MMGGKHSYDMAKSQLNMKDCRYLSTRYISDRYQSTLTRRPADTQHKINHHHGFTPASFNKYIYSAAGLGIEQK